MAQYRSIFNQAFFKGLTGAVVLSTGLAAFSTANAADTETPIELQKGEYTVLDKGEGQTPRYEMKFNGEAFANTGNSLGKITLYGYWHYCITRPSYSKQHHL